MKNKSHLLPLQVIGVLVLISVYMLGAVAAQNVSVSNAIPNIPSENWDPYKKAIEGRNSAITFYGMVIDQDGNALADAKVALRVQQVQFNPQYFVVPKYVRFDRVTGPDGHFAVTNAAGVNVEVVTVTKPGYALERTVKRTYGVVTGSVTAPIPFVLWKEGKKNPLITKDKFFDFIPDGRLYDYILNKAKIVQLTNSEGDFQFRLKRPMRVGNWDKFDWSFDFKGRNGNAFRKTDEGYFEMLFSPQDGYTNSFMEIHRASDQPWKGRGQAQFYFSLHGGRESGKISLIWESVAANAGQKTNEANIHIRYTLNPTGSSMVR